LFRSSLVNHFHQRQPAGRGRFRRPSPVAGLEDLDALVPAVKALGARHAVYGARPEHYQPVAEALLWTLDKGLGEAFTPDVKDAWTKVYGVLAATMHAGAAEASGAQAAE